MFQESSGVQSSRDVMEASVLKRFSLEQRDDQGVAGVTRLDHLTRCTRSFYVQAPTKPHYFAQRSERVLMSVTMLPQALNGTQSMWIVISWTPRPLGSI